MTDTTDTFEAVTYTPPSIVRNVGAAISIPLGQTNFLDIFSEDRDEQMRYVHRLLSLCYFFAGWMIVWFVIILVLKCKNPEAGCASGQAFDTRKPVFIGEDREEYDAANGRDADDQEPSSSSRGRDSYGSPSHTNESPIRKRSSRETDATAPFEDRPTSRLYILPSKNKQQPGQRRFSNSDSNGPDFVSDISRDDDSSFGSEANVFNPEHTSDDFADESGGMRRRLSRRQSQYEEDQYAERVQVRASRTRAAFVFFGTLVLSSGIVASLSSYRPFTDAMATSQEVIVTTYSLTRNVDGIVSDVSDATTRASLAINGIPKAYSNLCPGVPEQTLINDVGINPIQIITDAQSEFDQLEKEVDQGIAEVRDVLFDIDSVVDIVDKATTSIDDHLWILPFMILLAISVTVAVLGGTMIAWFEVSNPRIEKFLSWVVLPFLVLVALACWAMVIALCFGTAITSDICTAGPSPGSPDATVRAVLDLQGFDKDGELYQYSVHYTSGCRGDDPTDELLEMKQLADDTIKEINKHIRSIDFIGRDELGQRCGGQGVGQLVSGLEGLAAEIGVMGNAIVDAQKALNCPAVFPLYQKAIHQGVCTQVASASAAGFVLFLLMSIGLMVLISLRASWRETVSED